jgi:peptidoglycan/LPS O-acetylase OafA/YrhL
MTSFITKERSSSDQKREGQDDAGIDLEALKRPGQRHRQLPVDTHGHTISRAPLGRTALGRNLVHKFLSYPTPGSLKLRRTSWLDGVRGVAALAVYLFHTMGCWAGIVSAWHADETQTSPLQLPFIRTIFVSGGSAVSVFFVLSGYVLTYRCLRWIRAGSSDQVYPAVASSMFRRGFRLFLPPIFITFVEMLSTRFGFTPPLNFYFVAEESFVAQFADWLVETSYLINPIHNFKRAMQGFITHPKYDAVIWTIPVEFYGSIVCYILLLILARWAPSTSVRMGFIALFSCVAMALGSWNISLFSAGMLVADLNLGDEEREKEAAGEPYPASRRLLWTGVFLAAFYVAGFPTLVYPEGKTNPMPGFETIRALIPMNLLNMEDHARFPWSIGGVAMLVSISKVPRLKTIFETDFCQYLAKISFSLYLVHMFCLVLFGLTLQGFLLGLAHIEERSGLLYWCVCYVWFGMFTIPVFALAAQVEKWVDNPSVSFAKWLEGKCLNVYKNLYS